MKHSCASLLFVVLRGLPGAPDPPANRPEKVYSEQTATWFEDAASRASISADAALSEGRMQLFSIPRAGGPPRQLTRDPATLLHPQVSPDGRWIACTRMQQTKEIWRQKL